MVRRVSKVRVSGGDLLGFVAPFAGVLAILAMLEAAGLLRASEAALHARYTDWLAGYGSNSSVLLVETDASTVASWGMPPWSWEKIDALYRAVNADSPRVVALAEPNLRFLPRSAPPPDLQAAIAANRFIVPLGGVRDPALDIRSDGPIDAVRLRDGHAMTIAGATAQVAGLKVDGEVLPVSFAGGSVASLPAYRVAAGELPRGVFTGKIVLIGLGPELSGSVPTLAGPLSPARVQAQALAGLADGDWAPALPGWLRFCVALGLALVASVFTARLRPGKSLLCTSAVALTVLGVDFALYRAGVVRIGSSTLLLALGIGSLAASLQGRSLFLRHLARRCRVPSSSASRGASLGAFSESDEAFWQRTARTAELYFGPAHSAFATLSADSWEVVLHGAQGDLDKVAELHRDVRAEPYRTAYLTHRPHWVDGLVPGWTNLRTLVIPLIGGTRLLGFWMLSFQEQDEPDPLCLARVRELSVSIALSLQRRQRPAPVTLTWLDRLVGHDRLLDELSRFSQANTLAAQQEAKSVLLGGQLPCGVVVWTLLGEVCSVNMAMSRLVAQQGVAISSQLDLCDILSRLLAIPEDRVGESLRSLLLHDREQLFYGHEQGFVLSRSTGTMPGRDEQEPVLVLFAVPSRLVDGKGRDAHKVADAMKRLSWEPRELPKAPTPSAVATVGSTPSV